MNGQMKKYKESLGRTPEPIMQSQIPKIKLDIRGLVSYAKERDVVSIDLTQEEKSILGCRWLRMFVQTNTMLTDETAEETEQCKRKTVLG